MNWRVAAGRTAAGVLVLVVAALLVGQVLGQPVLLGFVETGSMAPTLDPGDGFIAIPAALAGPTEPGDVVVFDAENLHGGGLVTHRVVGETDRGFITKGDANPVTDQESSVREPPVQREQVVAEVLQIGGNVVVIPQIGLLVTGTNTVLGAVQGRLAALFGTRAFLGTQGLAYLLFAVGVIAYLVTMALERGGPAPRDRDRKRRNRAMNASVIVLALTLALVAVTTASMVVPAGPQQFGIISSDTDSPGARVIPKGTSETTTYIVPSNGLLPVVVFLEPSGEGIDVTPRELHVPSGQRLNATVTLTAPPQNGYYRYYLVEHRYLAVLPQGTIRALYQVHPWVPIIVIDAIVGIAFSGIGFALIGMGQVRNRSRPSRRPLSSRLFQWLR